MLGLRDVQPAPDGTWWVQRERWPSWMHVQPPSTVLETRCLDPDWTPETQYDRPGVAIDTAPLDSYSGFVPVGDAILFTANQCLHKLDAKGDVQVVVDKRRSEYGLGAMWEGEAGHVLVDVMSTKDRRTPALGLYCPATNGFVIIPIEAPKDGCYRHIVASDAVSYIHVVYCDTLEPNACDIGIERYSMDGKLAKQMQYPQPPPTNKSFTELVWPLEGLVSVDHFDRSLSLEQDPGIVRVYSIEDGSLRGVAPPRSTVPIGLPGYQCGWASNVRRPPIWPGYYLVLRYSSERWQLVRAELVGLESER